MEVKINQVVLHLLDPGASEPVLSDRAMDMDADLYERRPDRPPGWPDIAASAQR